MARELALWEAINEALRQEMQSDPNVFVLGEDVGRMGGAFWCTKGLQPLFGPERVLDTPISENGFMGLAIGASLLGLKPVVELQLVDFMGVAWDQIYNHAAKLRYMSGGQFRLQMVIRAPIGGGFGDAAQHSQVLHATFAHIPGLKVVVPSNPYDAKGLLIASVRDGNPVIFLEHKLLYGLPFLPPGSFGEVPEEPYLIPLGKANIVREGSDATIVSCGYCLKLAVDASSELEKEDISIEVVDVRTLKPLDRQMILRSASKTGRLLIVDEDYLSYGFTGEIAAIVAEDEAAFRSLKTPIRRLANPDIPVPFSEPLESHVLPSVKSIVEAAHGLLGGK